MGGGNLLTGMQDKIAKQRSHALGLQARNALAIVDKLALAEEAYLKLRHGSTVLR